MQLKSKKQARLTRVRASLRSSGRPRLTVLRSNKHIWAQLIDDATGTTVVSASSKALKGTKTERSSAVGQTIAKDALAKKVKKIVFDRGSYKFHGRVKALAEAARAAGLEF
jgi:large subunit ribosomal protein L18